MALDDGEVREFMGNVRARLENIEDANNRQGERFGNIEERLLVLEQSKNNWRTKGIYMGGGGLSIAGLIELLRSFTS